MNSTSNNVYFNSTTNPLITFVPTAYRLVGNRWYKRKRGNSTRKKEVENIE